MARNDVREAWMGLAAARRLSRDAAGAAAALGEALTRNVMMPDAAPVAEAIAREAGMPGWCGVLLRWGPSMGTVESGSPARGRLGRPRVARFTPAAFRFSSASGGMEMRGRGEHSPPGEGPDRQSRPARGDSARRRCGRGARGGTKGLGLAPRGPGARPRPERVLIGTGPVPVDRNRYGDGERRAGIARSSARLSRFRGRPWRASPEKSVFAGKMGGICLEAQFIQSASHGGPRPGSRWQRSGPPRPQLSGAGVRRTWWSRCTAIGRKPSPASIACSRRFQPAPA